MYRAFVRRAWKDHWPAFLAVGGFALFLWAQTNALVGVFYDDGIYVVLAKALAEGEGYRYLNLPGEPAASHYPFLYPWILSILWRLHPEFPANTVLFELWDSAALAGALYLAARYAREHGMSSRVAAPALVITFAAFPWLAIVGVRFSEPTFLLLTAGSLTLADRPPTGRNAMGAGLLAGLGSLTRSIGIVAIVGIPLAYVVRRKFKQAALALAGGVIVVLPWVIWVLVRGGDVDPEVAAGYGPYWNAAGTMNVLELLRGIDTGALDPIGRLFLPPLWPPLWTVLFILILLLTALGATRVFERIPTLVTTLTLYVGVVAIWPYVPDRFVWTALPWFGLLFGLGCRDLWFRRRYWRVVVAGLLLVMMFGFVPREVRSLTRRGFASAAEEISTPFRFLIPVLSQELGDSAVVASPDESLVYLYTGNTTVPGQLYRVAQRRDVDLEMDEAIAYYCRVGVTHVFRAGSEQFSGILIATLIDENRVTPMFQVTDGPSLFELRCPN